MPSRQKLLGSSCTPLPLLKATRAPPAASSAATRSLRNSHMSAATVMNAERGQKGAKRGTPTTLTPGSTMAQPSPVRSRTDAMTCLRLAANATGLRCGWQCKKQLFMSFRPQTMTTASTRSPIA
eukprot:scaffold664_cov129-Isochrysis_galbana.AAC.7